MHLVGRLPGPAQFCVQGEMGIPLFFSFFVSSTLKGFFKKSVRDPCSLTQLLIL